MKKFSINLGQKFYSQEHFDQARKNYESEEKVPYHLINCVSAERHNKKCESEGKGGLVPKEFKWKEAVIGCQHYGKPRQSQHKEGTTRRPNQR